MALLVTCLLLCSILSTVSAGIASKASAGTTDPAQGKTSGQATLHTPPPTPAPGAPNCTTIVATDTDPAMQWFCQGSGARGCTNRHVVCAPPPTSTTQSNITAAVDNAASKGLVVFLPGTYLQPSDYSHIVAEFSHHGFHALGLFYPSAEGQNGCGASRASAHPTDLNCTATERFKVLTGADNGGHTNITAADSIVNRVAKALAFLGPPWSDYLDAETKAVRWSDVIISGHSNGADHAGFLSKNFNVSRALMFAGPNDNVGARGLDLYYPPAPWVFRNWTSNVTGQTATPPGRLYGFGVCGYRGAMGQHPSDDECWHWHPGWEAMGMAGPWFKADAIPALSDARSFAGLRHICSSALLPHGSSGDGYNHMASAADCCMPRFPDNYTDPALAGRVLWTNIFLHMLTSPTGIPPPPPAPGNASSCACVK